MRVDDLADFALLGLDYCFRLSLYIGGLGAARALFRTRARFGDRRWAEDLLVLLLHFEGCGRRWAMVFVGGLCSIEFVREDGLHVSATIRVATIVVGGEQLRLGILQIAPSAYKARCCLLVVIRAEPTAIVQAR